MSTIQNLTLQQIFPIGSCCWLWLAYCFGVYKRSKTVLLTLFFLVALIVMVKIAMPAPGQEISLKTVLPFVAFGLGIGGVIVYFTFVKD